MPATLERRGAACKAGGGGRGGRLAGDLLLSVNIDPKRHMATTMRIPNGPLFKRYEIYLMLALVAAFIGFASLHIVL